jgi:hypothetical protein
VCVCVRSKPPSTPTPLTFGVFLLQSQVNGIFHHVSKFDLPYRPRLHYRLSRMVKAHKEPGNFLLVYTDPEPQAIPLKTGADTKAANNTKRRPS